MMSPEIPRPRIVLSYERLIQITNKLPLEEQKYVFRFLSAADRGFQEARQRCVEKERLLDEELRYIKTKYRKDR